MSAVFRAIADPTRREILNMLREAGSMRASHIAAHFPEVTRIAISKHLKLLHEADLVQLVPSEDARERLYSLNPEGIRELNAWLKPYNEFWQQKLAELKQIVEDE